MASSPWISLAPATLRAACAASAACAISLAAWFTIGNLAPGAYFLATGRTNAHALDLLGFIVSGAVMFVLSLALSFIITIPVSTVIAAGAYRFFATLRAAGRRALGAFLVGAIWRHAPLRNIYFGSWISPFVIAGPAGCAGARAFARHLPDNATNSSHGRISTTSP